MEEWLNTARQAKSGELRELVQLWVVGFSPPIDDRIRADLKPFPRIKAVAARRQLRERWNRIAIRGNDTYFQLEGSDERADRWKMALVRVDTTAAASLLRVNVAYLGKAIVDPPPAGGYRACANCGRAFAAQRTTATYCGVNCRTAAFKRRKRA